MNKQELYPICTILYKTDNNGWHYAIMSGDEKTCKIECEKLKQENNWFNYKCYESVRCVDKQDIPFQNHNPEAEYLHRCTLLIKSPFDEKFYYPEENMPCKMNKEVPASDFGIIVKGEGEDDENIWEPTDIEDFESGTNITISFCDNKDKIITIADNLIKDISDFIQKLKNAKYANIIIEEYTYTKFLAWEVENVIRFIVQDYSEYKVKTILDKVVSKKLFYQEFDKFFEKVNECIIKHKNSYDKFKQQQSFINSLKWEYDKTNKQLPQEYTCFDWNKSKSKDLDEFTKEIKEKSSKNVLDWENPSVRFNCLDLNEYYYWLLENKIVRTIKYSWKREDIKRFLVSDDFIFIDKMSLSDIYNQLLDKGYNSVIDCNYMGKKIKIYANGQVSSNEASQKQIKEVEQIIQSIADSFADRNNIKVSDITASFKDYNINFISYRDGNMKL